MGMVRLVVRCGARQTEKEAGKRYGRCWETPFRECHFRGERSAVTLWAERLAAMAACETGAFEKAAPVCREFGMALCGDRVRDVTLRAERACDWKLLPPASGLRLRNGDRPEC